MVRRRLGSSFTSPVDGPSHFIHCESGANRIRKSGFWKKIPYSGGSVIIDSSKGGGSQDRLCDFPIGVNEKFPSRNEYVRPAF